jgi:hypothetical protein
LIFTACRMIGDIKPYLQNIAGRYTIAFDRCAEDSSGYFGALTNTSAPRQVSRQTQFPERFSVDSFEVQVRPDTVNEL